MSSSNSPQRRIPNKHDRVEGVEDDGSDGDERGKDANQEDFTYHVVGSLKDR